MNKKITATNEQMKDEIVKALKDSLKGKNREIKPLKSDYNHLHYHLHQIEQNLDKVLFNLDPTRECATTNGGFKIVIS